MASARAAHAVGVPPQRTPGHDALPREPWEVSGRDPRRVRRPHRVALLFCLIGLTLTGLSTWAADRVDDNTEQRLLEVQTKQVGAVLSTAIMVIQSPLTTTMALQTATGSRGAASFEQSIATSVGPDKVFVSASLWQGKGTRMVRLTTVGASPAMTPGAPSTRDHLAAALDSDGFTVRPVDAGGQRRMVYALGDPESRYVLTGELALPANRRSPVDNDSAFADLHYAIHLGPRADLASLSTTDVDPTSLPFRGRTAVATVPFGDTVLTVVTSPRRHLGASLSQRLPIILLVGGLALTLVSALTGQQLVRRRLNAEDSAAVVTGLYDRVEVLYGQQRDLSVRLQRALLPPVIPDVPHLQVAVEYVAGAHGVDIGGDWYSMIALGPDHFAFVVGDVSGRGIDAVAVMAQARFTLRAYLLRGDSPTTALEMCSNQFDVTKDGHIVTVIVGIGNWRTGEIVVANAGHPQPLVLTQSGAEYVDVATGPPLGTGPTRYPETTISLSPGATLFCFTDGLIERRNEGIDSGMDRLARTVAGSADSSVEDLVANAVRSLRSDDADDDIAVLALRWLPT